MGVFLHLAYIPNWNLPKANIFLHLVYVPKRNVPKKD